MNKDSLALDVEIILTIATCGLLVFWLGWHFGGQKAKASVVALEEPTPAKRLNDRFQWQKVYGAFDDRPTTWLLTDTNTHSQWIWVERGGLVSVRSE